MGLIVLWTLAGILLVSAIMFGWVTIMTHPRACGIEWNAREREHDRIIADACADLDAEYRELLRR